MAGKNFAISLPMASSTNSSMLILYFIADSTTKIVLNIFENKTYYQYGFYTPRDVS